MITIKVRAEARDTVPKRLNLVRLQSFWNMLLVSFIEVFPKVAQ